MIDSDAKSNGWIVVDLDRTLFNCDHRWHLQVAGEFDAFHDLCHKDEVYPDVANLLKSLIPSWNVVACTGRPQRLYQKTLKQLRSYQLWFDAILMRPENNYQRTEDLKISLLEGFFGSKSVVLSNVAFVLEDQDKIVEAFREYGLNCWQVR